jgi:hypothetical protein
MNAFQLIKHKQENHVEASAKIEFFKPIPPPKDLQNHHVTNPIMSKGNEV